MKLTMRVLVIVGSLVTVSCDDGGENPQSCTQLISDNSCSVASQNQCVHEIMLDHYLWYDQVPVEIDYEDFESPAQTLDFLRYQDPGPDRFSYVDSEEAFDSLFSAGQYVGFGFSYISDPDGRLLIRFVYDDSAAGMAGLQRGDEILSINGSAVSQLTESPGWSAIFGGDEIGLVVDMELAHEGLENRAVSMVKGIVNINTVLHSSVIEQDDVRIGYLVFKSFLDTSVAELNAVFSDFAQAGVDQVILDLRYNGGGSVAVSNFLASYFNPDDQGLRLYNRLEFNDKNQSSNRNYYLDSDVPSLRPEQLLVIASSETCSASEMLINGLRPYLDVRTLGSATCGKPVGMNPRYFCGTALLPVTFRISNSEGVGEYFDGIAPDCAFTDNADAFIDDYDRAFGDPAAPVLSAALGYSISGQCSAPRARNSDRHALPPVFANPLRDIIGAV